MNMRILWGASPIATAQCRHWLTTVLLVSMSVLSGCDAGIDRLWKEPRELLVDRVVGARDAQAETVEQFRTAMEEFKGVTGFSGGDLEEKFDRLNTAFTDSEAAAEEINDRIDSVVAASNRLLSEWEDELEQYHDQKFRRRSEEQFDITRAQSERMITSMRKAADKTKPVLDAFRDQVLFLKHNLNMQAITSLDAQTAEIEVEVEGLIREMEASISEANEFIKEMVKQSS